MAITIDRWHQALSLRGPQRAPQAARERAEALARGAGAALGGALQAWLQRHEGEVIRVRRLELALALDLARATDEAAPGYAAALARAIADAIDDGGADVVRFADRSAYVAAFAVSLAAGDAHQRWMFDEFDGLAPLPPAAALRTLVEQAPDTAWTLITRLAEAPAVFAMLAGADALRVLDVLITTARPSPPGATPPALPPPGVLACPAAAVLERLARAAAAGQAPDAALVATAIAAVLARGAMRAPVATTGAPAAIDAALEQRLASLAPALRAQPAGPDAPPRQAWVAQGLPCLDEATPCAAAGLVVLLDELDAWLDAACPARGAVALAALATAAAPDDTLRVWRDPAWRALLGVDAGLDIGDLGVLLAAHDARPAAAQGAAVAAAASRGTACCWRDAQRRTRGVDGATGLWLDSAPADAAADRACWRRARADEAALDHPLQHALPPAWGALVRMAAQFAWRRVAWRVPGLCGASLPWLRSNLLGGDGSVRHDTKTPWHWRCPRAPLHVLLAMTTLAAREHVWRGPPARRLSLEFHD
ncbi:MAG: hypothetical protein HY855_23130 [Burkholderiales bacterium]|nr:hypothetical protein [Burkholderiales bacterium]